LPEFASNAIYRKSGDFRYEIRKSGDFRYSDPWSCAVCWPSIRACLLILTAAILGPRPGLAHDTESFFRLDLPQGEIHGTELIPHIDEPMPCVVLLGGTLSQDRDGRYFDSKAPPRDALRRLAEALQAGGYGSVRYDRVGYGRSKPGPRWTGSYTDEAAVAAAVIEATGKRRDFKKVIVLGESAGAYVACLAARSGTQADGYVLLGALCGPADSLYEHAFGPLAAYADASPANLAWAMSKARYPLALARHYRAMLAAAERGDDEFRTDDQGFALVVGGLARRREELALPPDAMFRHLQAPVLALAGSADRNVPPAHAAKVASLLKEAGHNDATSRLIDGVDHSFQRVPESTDEQIRERFELTSFQRPYEAKAYHAILDWLYQRFPTPAEGHPEQVEQVAARPTAAPKAAAVPQRAQDRPETDPLTDVTPERLHLAPGIEIVPNVADAQKTAGVDTLEGRIGPLILGEGSQAHFIDMQSGLFVAEHPHSTESLIYTVRGQWVLCSAGRRQLMKAGSLFRFAAGTPTGYEVPFDDAALILIFKGDRITKDEREFIEYLKGMAARLEKDHASGTPFLLKELAADHPARVFARQVNAGFAIGK
jgi:pimeloyl-ACP methyl ester carboxylesterase/quercetin dioxygenase-like cupin family protein